jgi:pyridoxal phosphate phosphatase PHOSPHO2
LIDENSDTFVFEVLNSSLHKEMEKLHGKVQFTDLVDSLLQKLFESVSIKQLEECLRSIPFDEQMINAVKYAKEKESKLFILSDANTFYISTILKHHRIYDHFTEIITNPGYIENDRLRVKRFIGKDGPQHGCPNSCSVNICKGIEIERIIRTHNPERVIYIGDGRNDLCPSLKLGKNDFVFPRIGRALHKLVQNNESIKATLRPWNTASDVLLEIKRIIP